MAINWQIGDRIQDRWEILWILKGGMGVVYIVYDQEWHIPFAVKTFQDEIFARQPEIADRFTAESLSWIALDIHQNIVEARLVHEFNGKPYIFLEYVSGGDLSRWIGTARLTKNLPVVLNFAIQFCNGMKHALSKGIKAHRDIKPQNCLITEEGALKITDFGLAKVFDEEKPNQVAGDHELANIGLTHTGMAAGTPTHMAPEQFRDTKNVDACADIYSFGIVLYQMLEGRLPFVGSTWHELERLHTTVMPPMLRAQILGLNELVQKCLAKDPADRFSDFAGLREELATMYTRLTNKPAPEPISGYQLDATYWNNKALSLNSLGRSQEAIAHCDRALSLDPRLMSAWVNKGNALNALKQYDQAIACCDQALELNPSDGQVLSNKGAALNGIGKNAEALTFCDQALELDPSLAHTWNNKGIVLVEADRFEEALACFDHALELDSTREQAWANKGTALDKMGRVEEALICFDRALDLNPRYYAAYNNKGATYNKLGCYQDALVCHNRALEINRRDAVSWFGKGSALNELGQKEEAISCYEVSLEINPGYAPAWYNRGLLVETFGRSEEALTCFNRSLELDPLDADTLNSKANTLVELGRYEEAITCCDQALKLNSQHAEAHNNKGNALNALRRNEEALASYEFALKFNPNLAQAWSNKGVALSSLRRFEEAIRCFNRALELSPRFARCWHNKGAALLINRQPIQALRCFEEAHRLGFSQSAPLIAYCRQILGKLPTHWDV